MNTHDKYSLLSAEKHKHDQYNVVNIYRGFFISTYIGKIPQLLSILWLLKIRIKQQKCFFFTDNKLLAENLFKIITSAFKTLFVTIKLQYYK